MTDNLAYSDWNFKSREELIGGRLYSMAPRPSVNHNHAVVNVTRILGNALDKGSCTVFTDNAALFLDEENEVSPDVMVVCDSSKIKDNGIYGAPDLAVEVLSPSTATYNRHQKRDMYERFGVRELWIIDTANKLVDVYLLKNGRFEPPTGYHLYSESELIGMSGEEKAAIKHEIPVSIIPGLNLKLEDVFKNIMVRR